MSTLTELTLKELAIKKIERAIKLSHCVKIYVPSTLEGNQTTDNTEILNHIASKLSELNGGATIQDVTGCWNSDTHGLIKESVKVVYSYSQELSDDLINLTFDLAEKIKSEMSQEMVSIELDGILYLV